MSGQENVESPKPGVKHCVRHPDVETRLSCASCDTPICPKCMVMCDVGIKCAACVNKTSSHLTQIDNKHLMIAGGLGFVAGIVFGYLYPLLMGIAFIGFFGIPILGLIISYAIGRGMGGAIHKLSGRKMGHQMAAVVTITAVLGLLTGPFGGVVLSFFDVLQSAQNIEGNYGTSASFYGFSVLIDIAMAYLFITGLRGALLFK